MSEELLGPGRSKDSIRVFEDWLLENLKEPMRIADVEATYQYISGHEPRKIRQYLKAIATSGRIKIFNNSGEKMVALSDFAEHKKEQAKQPKLTLGQIIDKKIEKQKEDADIQARMKGGPCKHRECPPFTEDSCEYCSAFVNLRSKDFLKE